MKAVILNSGLGHRAGVLTSKQPNCMTEISRQETIISRQLKQLVEVGIEEAVVTTGPFNSMLVNYCQDLDLPIHLDFVKNPLYESTNYIYSIYCARQYLADDILLLHGDLVFENSVLDAVLESEKSCMAVSSVLPLSEKDFKAVVREGHIVQVGVDCFNEAVAVQPLYKLLHEDWKVWLEKISSFCEAGRKDCYAEDAFNEVSERCIVVPIDVGKQLCGKVEMPEDLTVLSARLRDVERRTVYMCFSTDILHSGHIAIIKKAARLGKVIAGVLTDEVVASYKRYPMLPFSERKAMFENVSGVYKVVKHRTLSYRENLEKYKPDYVVHGDDWVTGFQKPLRDEVVSILASYGGKLREFPYTRTDKLREVENRVRAGLALPDIRRGRLRAGIEMKGLVTAMEAHDGLTGLVVENTLIHQDGGARQFDAMWLSSLCDSSAKGKPDIELVDMTSRFRTIMDLTEVTTKPIIFDGDTGGRTEHFVYTVRSLERMGVSMVIIEDKTGLKKNSLFGTEVRQTQASIENFSEKISAGKKAQKTRDFMICARIESLILERGMEDALERAFAFAAAGADAVMPHSRRKDPAEIFEFIGKFRARDKNTYLVVVPTSYTAVTEEEFKARGVNVVIYANQLMRAAVPAVQNAAKSILEHHRALECDSELMPFSEIIRMIPEAQ